MLYLSHSEISVHILLILSIIIKKDILIFMNNRLVIINDAGLPKFIDAAKYRGKTPSIKKGSKLGQWFGKSIEFGGEHLDRNSSIKFLNDVQHTNLKKGFLWIKKSSDQDIINAFKKHLASIASPSTTNAPVSPSTPTIPQPQNKASYINISQQDIGILLELTKRIGEPEIGDLILKSWLTPPTDPFELYLYNVLTQFQFPEAKYPHPFQQSRQYIDDHIQKNLHQKGYQNNPTEFQKLHACLDAFDITKKGLFRFPDHPESTGGALTSLGYNTILTAFKSLNERPENLVFLDATGDNYLEGKNPKNKIVYCHDMPFQLSSENAVREFVQTILKNEKTKNPLSRPKAIFIPLQFADPEKESHQVLLVVEPSAAPIQAAKITMLNTHGNSLDMYRSFENAALQGAKSVYNDPTTTAIRNEKRLWVSASCSHNIVDYTLALTDILQKNQSVQKHVQEGKLQEMTPERELIIRQEHAKLIKAIAHEKLEQAQKFVQSL